MSQATADVKPGDLFVVDPRPEMIFGWIEKGEWLIDHRKLKDHPEITIDWGHVGVASRWIGSTLRIVQAEPGGAVEVDWPWEGHPHIWSTGILPECPGAASAALRYAGYIPFSTGGWMVHGKGVPYSFLDYAAIAMHAYHVPAPGLQHYIETTKHMICSQLGDQARQDGGSHLFDDGRWPGYVTPLDIALLLQGVQ